MQKAQYATGRDYGTQQVLDIEYTLPVDGEDEFSLIPAKFVDAARHISGEVLVFAFQTNGREIGPAVLREYDEGRYKPL